MTNSASLSSIFLPLLALTLVPEASALNFDALETPLIDVVTGYFCENSEGPLCSLLDNSNTNNEELTTTSTATSTVSTTTTGPTLGDFLVATGCDLGLVPSDFCRSAGEYDEKIDKKDREDYGMMMIVEDTSVVDGHLLGLLCGEDGYDDVPDEVCDALVGKEGNAGLVRSFCEAGTILPPGICDMVGIRQNNGNTGVGGGTSYNTVPSSVNGGVRRKHLRQ